jgi:ABC-type phosphate transport system substrate-binding protein
VAVAVIAHPEVRDAGLATEQLLAIYRGEWSRWSDGTPVVALLRERGDSSHDAIARAFPPFRAVNDAAIESRRFRVLYHDDDLVRAVLAIRGAIGISDVAVVRTHTPSPRILSVDGQAPGPEAVRDGRYPFVKPVAFVTRGELSPAARRFVEFARSDEGARVLESLGAVPGGEDGGP